MNNYQKLVDLLNFCEVEIKTAGNEEYKIALYNVIKSLTELERYW